MGNDVIAIEENAGEVFNPQGTAGVVWEALIACEEVTVAELSKTAGVSRPTISKALAEFAKNGYATRREQGRGENNVSLPDMWSAVLPDGARDSQDADAQDAQDGVIDAGEGEVVPDPQADDDTVTDGATGDVIDADGSGADDADADGPATSDEDHGGDGPDATDDLEAGLDGSTATTPGSDPMPKMNFSLEEAMGILREETERREAAERELARAIAEEEARRQEAAERLTRARMSEDVRQALTDLLSATMNTYVALVGGHDEAMVSGLDVIQACAVNVRRAARVTTARVPGASVARQSVGGERKPPQPLRPEVRAHLAKFPGQAFTAGEIAKVLDRSSGAVANALVTLAKNGEADHVSERPDRYRFASLAHDAAE